MKVNQAGRGDSDLSACVNASCTATKGELMRNKETVVSNTNERSTPVYRTYKDRVFRMLFSEKKRLLELYNALNGTDYTDEDDLTVKGV